MRQGLKNMESFTFYVNALWDEEAQVFYSESDIIGLHVEAPTIEDFQREVQATAARLVVENHITKRDLTQRSWTDMIPSIIVSQSAACAAPA